MTAGEIKYEWGGWVEWFVYYSMGDRMAESEVSSVVRQVCRGVEQERLRRALLA